MRAVDWRTCPDCGESHPYRADTPENIVVCRSCLVVSVTKEAVEVIARVKQLEFRAHNSDRENKWLSWR